MIVIISMLATFVNVPTKLNKIQAKAAITVCNLCLLLLIAAVCFILYCGHINKYGH